MARWMLIEPHYLNVKGTAWEYIEIDRGTNKQVRRQFPVPRFLDPNDPGDWTEKSFSNVGQLIDGKVVVSDGVDAASSDIIFSGDPTPNMVPLDDAAKAISAQFSSAWKAPNETTIRTHSQSLLDDLERQMQLVEKRQAQASAVPLEGMEKLLAAMTQMMQQNQQLIAAVVGNATPAAINSTGAYEQTVPPEQVKASSVAAPARRV